MPDHNNSDINFAIYIATLTLQGVILTVILIYKDLDKQFLDSWHIVSYVKIEVTQLQSVCELKMLHFTNGVLVAIWNTRKLIRMHASYVMNASGSTPLCKHENSQTVLA